MSVAGKNREYVAFSFMANGSIENVSDPKNSCLTLVHENDSGKSDASSLANFFTVAINPVTGEVSTFQP